MRNRFSRPNRGTHARAIQQFYDFILPHIARVDGTLLMVNQVRSRIEMTREAQSAAQGYKTVTNLNYSDAQRMSEWR